MNVLVEEKCGGCFEGRITPESGPSYECPRCKGTALETRAVDFEEVSIRHPHSSLILAFGNSLIVRFKKLGADHRPRNYPTQRARMMARQLPVPGLPAVPLLTVGYTCDPLRVNLTDVKVILQVEGQSHCEWEYSLMTGAQVVQLPLAPAPAAAAPKRASRVRAKAGVAVSVKKKRQKP